MAEIGFQITYEDFSLFEDQFYRQSETVALMLDSIHKKMENLRHGGWTGVGAESFFFEMYSQVFPAIEALRDVLYGCSRLVDNLEELYSSAELEASRHLYG